MSTTVDALASVVGAAVDGDRSVTVTSVAHDSRAVDPGALFCCVPGASADGHAFADQAVEAGAVALLVERPVAASVPQLLVPQVRRAMGPAADAVYDHPSRLLDVAGVTGTNGKTTTTHLLQAILTHAGRPTEVIGTLSGARTTPEAPELQATFARLRDAGTRSVAMEVSSHALDQGRVDGTWFRVAVFTNLSRDHLDYHRTMDAYFAAKAMLFRPERCAAAVVNIDDQWGRRLAAELVVPWEPYSLGLVEAVRIAATEVRCRWEGTELRVPLGGRFNLANALGAATAAKAMGIDPEVVAAGLAQAPAVAGRLEAVGDGQPFQVLVDYAHTPDGLEQVLRALRDVVAEAGRGRILTVFGAGGDRDATKRPAMGQVAATFADRVYLTSDNPRREDPATIIEDVKQGIPAPTDLVVEPDRRAAIAAALADAAPGDIVLIAGKGHETTQTIGDQVLPFDDRQVTRELLEELRR